MKKSLFIAASTAVMALSTPQAFAQAKNFERFSVGLNYNSAQSTSTIKFRSTSLIGQEFSGTGTGQFASLQAQYVFAVNENIILGIGATAALASYNLGTIFTTLNVDGTQKQQYSIDFTPGAALSDSLLLYGRASYISAKAGGSSTAGSIEQDATGMGYGVGVRGLATKNIYWQAEYSRNNYDNISNATWNSNYSSNVFSLGIGYKF